MLRLFIGYDPRETIAAHVLAHSINSRSSIPVSFTLLNRQNLKGIYDRPRGEFESTDFSLSRFIVPYLCNYEGWAVFLDCDMLCLGDVVELAHYMTLANRWNQAVQVYEPELPRHPVFPTASCALRNHLGWPAHRFSCFLLVPSVAREPCDLNPLLRKDISHCSMTANISNGQFFSGGRARSSASQIRDFRKKVTNHASATSHLEPSLRSPDLSSLRPGLH